MSRRAAVAPALALVLVALLTPLTGTTSSAAPHGSASAGQQPDGPQPFTTQRVQPNILVLMLDDMRDDELRFMPHVRRLVAERGVRFTNSFSPYPLCCPARASFLTGRYTHNHGVWSHKPPFGFPAFEDRRTLPVWLSRAGYRTMFLGKYLNGYGRKETPAGDPSLRYVPPGWTDWRGSVDNRGTLSGPEAGGTYRYFDPLLSVNGHVEAHHDVYQTRLYGRITRDMIHGAARSPHPFFFWVSFTAPHSGAPREADDPRPVRWPDGTVQRFYTAARPEGVRGRFDQEITRLPGAGGPPDRLSEKPSFLSRRPPLSEAERVALLETSRQRAEALSVVDAQVARLMRTLRRTGQLDDTYVLLTSDNGYLLGEHRVRVGKILPYDPAIRVPLVVRGPGIPPGQVRTDPFLTIDLAPTLLQMAGARPRPTVDGLGLLDVARHGDRGWTRGVLTDTGPRVLNEALDDRAGTFGDVGAAGRLRHSVGLRTGRYLYVEHGTGERELYDLSTDPLQRDNRAGDPGYRGAQGALADTLDRLRRCERAECRAPLPASLRAPPAGQLGRFAQ